MTTAASAGVVGWLTSRSRSWDFIQQTGGMRIEQPVDRDGRLVLPVEYDVTGTRGVTHRPTLLNSGLAVRRIEAHLVGDRRRIVLRLWTQVVEHDSAAGPVYYAPLEGLTIGSYEVYYEDAGEAAKLIGKIEVK